MGFANALPIELDAGLYEHGEAADEHGDDSSSGVSEEAPKCGGPKRQPLGRLECLNSCGPKAEVREEHAADPRESSQ